MLFLYSTLTLFFFAYGCMKWRIAYHGDDWQMLMHALVGSMFFATALMSGIKVYGMVGL